MVFLGCEDNIVVIYENVLLLKRFMLVVWSKMTFKWLIRIHTCKPEENIYN